MDRSRSMSVAGAALWAWLIVAALATSLAVAEDRLDASTPRTERRTIRIGVVFVHPFVSYIDGETPKGFAVQVAKGSAKAVGLEAEIVALKNGNGVEELNRGEVDVIACLSLNQNLLGEVEFSNPILITPLAIFHHDGAEPLCTTKDLRGRNIVAASGGLDHQWLQANGIAPTRVVDNAYEAFAGVAHRAHDYTLCTVLVGRLVLRDMRNEGFDVSHIRECEFDEMVFWRSYAMAVRHDDHQLLADLNDGLEMMRTSGQMEGLRNQWLAGYIPTEDRISVPSRVAQIAGVTVGGLAILGGGWLAVSRAKVRKQRRELDEAEARYRHLFDRSGDAVLMIRTADERVIQANESAARLYGVELPGFLGRSMEDFTVNVGQGKAIIDKTVAAGFATGLRSVHRRADGRSFPVEMSGLVVEHAGQPCIIAIHRDISERLRAEEEIQRREAKYRSLFDGNIDATLVLSASTMRVLQVNRAACDLYEMSPEELAERTYFDLTTRPEVVDMYRKVLETEGECQAARCVHRAASGRTFPVEVNARVLEFDGGPAILVIIHDTTERERSQEEIRRREAQYRNLFDSNLLATLVVRQDTRIILQANPAACALYKRAREQLEGQPIALVAAVPDRIEALASALAQKGQILGMECAQRDSEGRVFPVEVNACTVEFDAVPAIVLITLDITDREQARQSQERLQEALAHSQKLDSLGLMAGGIAHDFNNLLTAMIGNASLAQALLPDGAEAAEPVSQVLAAGERAADLTKQLLAYAGKGRFVVEPVDVGLAAKEMAAILGAGVPRSCALKVEVSQDAPAASGDPTQVRQILLNLITNAVEAIGERPGEVRVSVRGFNATDEYLQSSPWPSRLVPGEYCALEVQDDGPGMTPEVLERIFDPFFSTKSLSRSPGARGLGLAVVQRAVEQHAGAIKVHTGVGVGTMFRVLLPISGATPQQPPRIEPKPRGVGRVLVVDDEPMIRDAACRLLEHFGWTAEAAHDGPSALGRLREGPTPDVLLLDLTMPGMSGQETLRHIRASHADLPVVLTSGYSGESLGDELASLRPAGFIHKPFGPGELQEILAKAVARPREPANA